MKIFLMTGPSASGKSTIAEQISSNLQVPIIKEREIIHRIAQSYGFSRGRNWLAAAGIQTVLDEVLAQTLAAIEGVEGDKVILDGSYDARLIQALNTEGNQTFIIAVTARDEIRRERMAGRIESGPEEALAEMQFIDEFKHRAGMAEIIEKADLTVDNNLTVDETTREIHLYLGSEFADCLSGPERLKG
ncbi:MAG: AAA family ATPase [Candidatus Levybacteria bacterium]|nr:AAA family ATPase [Candidatus Levybacteria bacterium]